MTMRVLRCLAPALLLATLACSPYTVKVDYDRTAPMSAYKTFDWYAASKRAKAEARGVEDPLMDRRVRLAVERELTAKGFRAETVAEPDFLVTYYPVYRNRKVRTTTHVGMGWGRPWGYRVGTGFRTSQTRSYKEGTIVIEVVDSRTNALVWQAVAEGALTGLSRPEEADAQVGEAVRKLLADFPPR